MVTLRLTRLHARTLRLCLLALFLLVLVALIASPWNPGTRKNLQRVLQPDLVLGGVLYGTSEGDSHRKKLARVCRAHGFKPWSSSHSKRQIYDLFLFSTELDWLEIRLHTLAPFVDFFVIVESKTTFTGLEKPLHLQDHWDRFTPYHNKIIYQVVDDPGPSVGARTWDHEDYMRNALWNNVFPRLVGTAQEAQVGDVLIVSDIDEIPKPATVALLRHCLFPDRLTLRSHFYYYSFQWLHGGEQWPHPQVTTYHGLKNTISPKDLRNGEGGRGWPIVAPLRRYWQEVDLWNAAWHCSSGFATLEEMRTKMQSFSHVPWNTAENRDQKTILNRVRHGQDLFGRIGETYQRIDNNQDVPQHVLQHKSTFGYLLDRDGENAGFTDVRVDELDGVD